jgi:hypothetical protein
MALTYNAIATVTVGSGGASSIEFTAIPQTYTDLLIKVSGRSSVNTTGLNTTFNGTTTNYANVRLYSVGTGSASDTSVTNAISNTMIDDSSYTANTFGNGEIYIPNYTGSTNKSVSVDGVTENNSQSHLAMWTAGMWSDSAAITSIKLESAASGNLVQHTTATLYGIKNTV